MAERTRQIQEETENPKELRRKLGAWLKNQREAAGLTQADLADQLGLRYYSFVSQVENGAGRIPQDLYRPWALALGSKTDEFAFNVLMYLEPGLYSLLNHFHSRAVHKEPGDRGS